jgi:hypothetical protein
MDLDADDDDAELARLAGAQSIFGHCACCTFFEPSINPVARFFALSVHSMMNGNDYVMHGGCKPRPSYAGFEMTRLP